uniref:NOP2/Sun RNA methyltransferase 4 n=1 Tax=Cyprinus carpio TaxID=7962 RepID=A0A8C1XSL8_CYPCA
MASYVCTRYCINKFKDSIRFIQRRYRVKTKWAATRPKFPATELALHNFDTSYSRQLRDLLALYLSCHATELEPDIKCLVFPQGDIYSSILGYYLLDATSVLPVLVLVVQPGHTILDLCAAPGGKTLALLQTHSVNYLWANYLTGSHTMRLRRTLQKYLPKEFLDENKIHITSTDGQQLGMTEEKSFDRVNVPCTTDRHSTMVEENNIFKRSRTNERQKLPLLQTEILCSECVNPHHSMQVQDLRWFVQRFSDTFHFAPQLSVGELVLPHLCANFGPIYMCKLH